MSDNLTKSFLLLFDRPNEPLISPKGDNKAVFQLTEQFVVSLLYFPIINLFVCFKMFYPCLASPSLTSKSL